MDALCQAECRPRRPECAAVCSSLLPLARFSARLDCICLVTFHLDLGQAMELVYLSDSRLAEGESLVLMSQLPYINLFQSLLQLIAPESFDKLEPCLEAGDCSRQRELLQHETRGALGLET